MGGLPPFGSLIVYDTARFGRDRYEVAANLHHLERKCGITVHFVKLPATGEPMDLVIRQIVQSFDTMHSLMSAEGARRGQRQNIRQGYRAGGSAPYGYQLQREQVGINPQGEVVYKSRLAPDKSQATVVAEYFERRGRGESRRFIADDFSARGVPTPRGSRRWLTSTLRAFEDNHRVYPGQSRLRPPQREAQKRGGVRRRKEVARRDRVADSTRRPPSDSKRGDRPGRLRPQKTPPGRKGSRYSARRDIGLRLLRRALLGFRDALLLLQFEPLGARGLPGPRYSQKRYRVNREIASHFPRPSP